MSETREIKEAKKELQFILWCGGKKYNLDHKPDRSILMLDVNSNDVLWVSFLTIVLNLNNSAK